MDNPTDSGNTPGVTENVEVLQYDFSPFLSAPAVSEIVNQVGSVQPIHIPEASIPSPLAPSIQPQQLIDLKNSLVGKANSVKGNEIWQSWKRAWDLWNNYYIEGRISYDWLAGQLERREKEWEHGKKRKWPVRPPQPSADFEKIPKVYTIFTGDIPPPPCPGRKWVKAKGVMRQVATGRKIKTKTGNKITVKRNVRKLRVNPGGYVTAKKGGRRATMNRVLEGGIVRLKRSYTYEYVTEATTRPGREVEIYYPERDVETDEEREEDELEERLVTGWELVDDFDNPAAPNEGGSNQIPNPQHSPSSNLGPGATVSHAARLAPGETLGSDAEEDPGMSFEVREDDVWPSYPEDEDGFSGGFFPLKDTDHYATTGFYDVTNNSVWRPRRVGEQNATVRLNNEAGPSQEGNLQQDGGIDCWYSPYPTLRWAIKYTKTNQGLIKKKPMWDGVTGTIFNMPTAPKSNIDGGKKGTRVKPNIFPLDIRRMTSRPVDECRPTRAMSEETLDPRWQNPLKRLRVIDEHDPWHVSPEQELKRSKAPRLYPPRKQGYKNEVLIPCDNINWLEKRLQDDVGDSKYFVTNLHGGTLIVNGQEVKKGRVAGPLPKFAVIECPGNQVAFWWGVGGRNFGRGQDDPKSAENWEALRKMPGWEYCGMKTGEVWDMKIIDRMKRVSAGGGPEDDDEQWEAWRTGKDPLSNPISSTLPGPPQSFDSEEEELKWIFTQSVLLANSPPAKAHERLVEPTGDDFWPGPVPEPQDKPHGGAFTEEARDAIWTRDKTHVIKEQSRFVAKLGNQVKEQQEEILRERKKRRGSDVDNPEASGGASFPVPSGTAAGQSSGPAA